MARQKHNSIYPHSVIEHLAFCTWQLKWSSDTQKQFLLPVHSYLLLQGIFHFMVILAAPVDKSGMSINVS